MVINSVNNVTYVINPIFKPSSQCWEWCSREAVVYQSNIDISNLGVIAVAMVVLLLYNISIEWSDVVCKHLNINQDQLRFTGHTLVYFAFMLLAVFLVYYTWFN